MLLAQYIPSPLLFMRGIISKEIRVSSLGNVRSKCRELSVDNSVIVALCSRMKFM